MQIDYANMKNQIIRKFRKIRCKDFHLAGFSIRAFNVSVKVISRDPRFKDDNVRFPTIPLKALSDQVVTIVNRTLPSLHGRSLEIVLTVPLRGC